VEVLNGKFMLKGEISQPTKASLRVVTLNDSLKPEQQVPWECDRVDFFLCEGRTIILGTDSLATAKLTTGCNENRLYQSFAKELTQSSFEIENILAEQRAAYAQKDTCAIKFLKNKYALAISNQFTKYHNFILEHPSSHVSVHLLNNYVHEIKDSVRLQFATSLLKTLTPTLSNSPIAEAIKERIHQKTFPMVGKQFPPVALPDQSGKEVGISSLMGKITLIEFWASWCYPCRQDNPRLLKLYQKYKDSGFQIISISIDQNTGAWLQAVRKDKLTWPQFIDVGPAYAGKASRLYGIGNVPANFLINADGKIIFQRMDVEQLEQKIKSLLKINP
jgi:thiol-disulfide isomerase/thioredoxin